MVDRRQRQLKTGRLNSADKTEVVRTRSGSFKENFGRVWGYLDIRSAVIAEVDELDGDGVGTAGSRRSTALADLNIEGNFLASTRLFGVVAAAGVV